ncbi:hypothetical protein HRI_001406300 [Hibiscus trionum]|uniref:Myb-like domain-containing protein n=1 Tax=Hibiscus trionum TaxID=183268 RepID=A0A9W7HGP8_HIBTR|nr:hypothetical protein HRI_001406300 [Hibiscus trionum]
MGKLTQERERFPSHSTLNQVEVEGDDILKEAVGPQTTDACQELVSSGGKGSSTGADDKFITSNHSTRFREKFSLPPTRQSRKKVPWTNEEEEILKKGVEEFSCSYDGTIPWKRILEFGSQVFPKDKTPTDLKNKWRAMCKGSPNCK